MRVHPKLQQAIRDKYMKLNSNVLRGKKVRIAVSQSKVTELIGNYLDNVEEVDLLRAEKKMKKKKLWWEM